MNQAPLLTFRNVNVVFQQRQVLQNISLDLGQGEFTYLVGPTGVGKSTLLKCIYADALPNQGYLRMEKFELHKIGKSEIPFLRRKMGIIFQDFQLLPDRNVYDNIAFCLNSTGWKGKDLIRRRVTEVLVSVGMSAKVHAFPHQLSGGQQQRVAIARALINYPLLIIADEPTGNLDPVAAQQIMELLLQINRNGTSVLMATHEYELLKAFPSRVMELIPGGQIREHQSPESFLTQLWK